MKKIVSLFLLLPWLSMAQTQAENYILKTIYKGPNGTLPVQSILYVDGLGRPVQQKEIGQSATGKDIITPIEYDAMGRQPKEYLPYSTQNSTLEFQRGTIEAQKRYYETAAYENTTNAYSEKQFEASPFNRVLQQAAPGNDWKLGSGHEIKMEYVTNTAQDRVIKHTVNSTWNASLGKYDTSLSLTAEYPANSLYKTITKNENWTSGKDNTIEEFTNTEGKVVLKRAYNNGQAIDTYYINDRYNNLSFVLSPKAEGKIDANTLDQLSYQYQHDHRKRLVAKKVPGKLWEYIVYDLQDRPIITGPTLSPYGDGSQGVMVTEYDVYGRVVKTGWKAQAMTASSRAAWQNNTNSEATPLTIAENEVLTKNYYDTYTFPDAPAVPTSLPLSAFGVASNVKGMATGSWVRVCTTATEMLGETSYTLYDTKYRPVRTYTTNYLGGYTQVDSRLDFTGKTLETLTTHKKQNNSDILTVKEKFTYSAQDRLLTHTHQVNNEPVQLLSSNTYDELGQLMTKKVGGTDATGQTALQKVDYAYNIRGWLKGINNVDNLNIIPNENDLFSFKINYNLPDNYDKKLYNGNISQVYWKTASDNLKQGYNYAYDNLNRLNSGMFHGGGFDEYLNYDINGNITSLNRTARLNATDNATTQTIDALTYIYANNSNQLLKVIDQSLSPSGFKGGTNTGDDYAYDAFGNLIKDANKGFARDPLDPNQNAIIYNHLNQPVKIGSYNGAPGYTYTYNALGNKVKMQVYDPNLGMRYSSASTEYFAGGFMYKNPDFLFYIQHAEGMVAYTKELRTDVRPWPQQFIEKYSYNFNYTDHLGNIRLIYQDTNKNGTIDPTTEIVEENHYYPFGLRFEGYNNTNRWFLTSDNLKYNGKEWQEQLGLNTYDYGARHYTPDAPRFWQIDPKAEEFDSWSPYNYAMNNPIYFIDPDGMAAVGSEWHPENGKLVADKGDSTQSLADYQGVSYDKAAKQLADNGYTVNDKGILNLNVGDKVDIGSHVMNEVAVGGTSKGTSNSNSNSSTPWMNTAESQLGVKEKTNNNDGVQVEKYLKSGGIGKGNPWCGSFVNWVLQESDINVSGVRGNPNRALNWRGFGVSLTEPAYGAIATRTRKGGGHVGFVAGITSKGSIVLLGGNQSDMVKYESFAASSLKYNYPLNYKPNYTLPLIKNVNKNTKMH